MWLAVLMGGAVAVSWAYLPFDFALLVTIFAFIITTISLYLGWKMEKEIREGFKRSEEGNKRMERIIEEGFKRSEEGNKRLEKIMEDGFKRLEIFLNETNRMIEGGRRETREILSEIQRTQADIARILEKMDERAAQRHRELMGR